MNSVTQKSLPNEIHTCEVCENEKLESVLDLGNHPLCDDLVPVGDSRNCIEYPIEILYCAECCTAHQRFQVPKRELFPTTYHYRSRFTADVLNGMSALVDATAELLDSSLNNKVVFDIGCNDGSLLDFFRKKSATTIGIEPTGAYKDALDKGHMIYNDFFSPELALDIKQKHGCPDVITFTNVFAHIENLSELINALKILISPTTLIVIENHYLGAVLEQFQFDTFYHEHPRTYSLTSFIHIAKNLGLKLSDVNFPSRYGGNIRVFLSGAEITKEIDHDDLNSILLKESFYGDRLKKMYESILIWKKSMNSRIGNLVLKHGKLSAKAFPGRAAILVKLLELDSNSISAVFEKPGSMKIEHYLPGTRIPILSDDELFSQKQKNAVIINLAWHISEEIKKYLIANGVEAVVVDILNPNEFSI
jgi:hypothetical protein